MKTYGVTRDKGAKMLGVSTRTIDRYIRGGKLSYKKVANKVLLAKEELDILQKDFSALHQEVSTEIVGNQDSRSVAVRSSIEESIDEKVDKFFLIFKEKDKVLEEKNKIIFVLQQRVNDLESKINNMIALPDYDKEKKQAIVEKEKLQEKIDRLQGKVKTERVKNIAFVVISLLFILIAIFFMMNN
ncbi:helix-turn-helix domain-containing protein [Candidatus Gracilibacteria bacterium]|nr:helix-turn-helix domain-containing protein [Candidatus Gracilibacteria bacterium]